MKRRLDRIQDERSQTIEAKYDSISAEISRVADTSYNAGTIISNIDAEFARVTKLDPTDITFLFLATALQCVRQYYLTPFRQRLDDQTAAKQVKGEKEEKSNRSHTWYNPSLEEIIESPVPFDANRQAANCKGVLKGAGKMGHRLTLGHDPILGWIFGTANIATSTLTTWKFDSYHVETMLGSTRGGLSDFDTITNRADTGKVLHYTEEKLLHRGMDGKKIIALSLVKEWVHLKSDIRTANSLPFPIVSAVSTDLANNLAQYGFDMENICTVAKQAAWAEAINMLVALLHGMLFYLHVWDADASAHPNMTDIVWPYRIGDNEALNLHKVKTQKILTYSNLIASSSNVIYVAISKDVQKLDLGGLAVTLGQLISSFQFIQAVKKEFLERRWHETVMGTNVITTESNGMKSRGGMQAKQGKGLD